MTSHAAPSVRIPRIFASLFFLSLSMSAFAGDNNVKCWEAAEFDKDADGYADYFAHKDDRVEVSATDAFALTCPVGWVKARGDCDDNNPLVFPRRQEVFGNNTDDNCDGRIDEPTFVYGTNGFTVNPTGVGLRIRVNDPDVVQAYQSTSYDLLLQYEYQRLDNTATTMTTSYVALNTLFIAPSYALAESYLGGLSPETPYRIRAQFYRRLKPYAVSGTVSQSIYRANGPANAATPNSNGFVGTARTAAAPTSGQLSPVSTATSHRAGFSAVPIGELSGWYYTATDASNVVGIARGALVRRALYEGYLSSLGYTGYRGSYKVDGTRYGADVGEKWCSEFYSWIADFELDGMGHRSNVSKVKQYFEDRDALTVVDHPSDFIHAARMGDYLAMDTNHDGKKNHSAMFLAIDAATDRVWSVDGNVSGSSDIDDSYKNRRAGNETFTLHREFDVVSGHGHIDFGMLK